MCVVHAAAQADPKKRVVVTGMGLASVFGNDYDTYYNQLLEGVSGVDHITRFDASEFPTNFAAQIKDFDNEGLIDKKNARRYDDCLSYTMVAGRRLSVMLESRRKEIQKDMRSSTSRESGCSLVLVWEDSKFCRTE